MNMSINPDYLRRIQKLAEDSGRSVDDVLNEVVSRGLDQVPAEPEFEYGTPESIEEAKRIVEWLRSLPSEGPVDGFSGSDHDEVLYPSEP
jgi:hypothetical protein